MTQILNFSQRKYLQERFVNKTQNSSENSKPFWRLRFGRGLVVRPPFNGEGLRDIQHGMSMIIDTRFQIRFIMTVYYKMRQIYYKNRKDLLQNAFYKMRRFYYKIRRLFQTGTVQCEDS